MSLNPDKNVRLYYSIKEVSEMLDVNITTLRFWEKEFPQLKPKVTAAKVRQYSEKDIALLRTIRSLVKVRGFKIAAARKYLMEDMHGAEDRAELLDTLISVRDQLKDLKASLGELDAGRAGVSGRGWFYFKARSLAPCVSQAGAKPWLSVQSLLTNGAISRTRAHIPAFDFLGVFRVSPLPVGSHHDEHQYLRAASRTL